MALWGPRPLWASPPLSRPSFLSRLTCDFSRLLLLIFSCFWGEVSLSLCLQLLQQTTKCTYTSTDSCFLAFLSSSAASASAPLRPPFPSSSFISGGSAAAGAACGCSSSLASSTAPPDAAATAAVAASAGAALHAAAGAPSAAAPAVPTSAAAAASTAALATNPAVATTNTAAAATSSGAAATAVGRTECHVVVRLLHAPADAAFASLVREALQCLLWGSDSDLEVSYEFTTPQQQQQQQEEQQELHQQSPVSDLEPGCLEVRVLHETRVSAAGSPSSRSSSSSKVEKGRMLIRSLEQVPTAAELVTPAAQRRPEGEAAILMAAAALQQQQQRSQQQQLLLLQRSRAALPLRTGTLWAALLCAEAKGQLRQKTGGDVLPLAVAAVEAAPQLALSWCTLGHALRLRGRLWESRSCYQIAQALNKPAAPATAAAAGGAAAVAAAVPAKLTEALERALSRARHDPEETRKALPTMAQIEVGAPWGLAVEGNPPELGGLFVAYVVEGSKADKAGLARGNKQTAAAAAAAAAGLSSSKLHALLISGDQIVVANGSIVLGLPFADCLDALRPRRLPFKQQQQQQQEALLLEPLQLEVYRGPLPLLYGAPGFAVLQRLDAVSDMLGLEESRQQQQHQLQQHHHQLLLQAPAGRLRGLLQGPTTNANQQHLF
ncbi:hypothetical protein Efla_003964 [Eimeria flavescens]